MLKEYNLVRKLSILLFICTIPQHNIYPPPNKQKIQENFPGFLAGLQGFEP